MKIPPQLANVIESLRQLPSLGPRQATRLAFYLAGTAGQAYGQQLARDIAGLNNLTTCNQCFFVCTAQHSLCEICTATHRDNQKILIVEKETDVLSLEEAGAHTGHYLVIGPAPKMGGLGPRQQERLNVLKKRIAQDYNGAIEEIILGVSPSNAGDIQAAFLKKELIPYAKKISRLGRGLPTGADIEFADHETLKAALDRRG